MLSPFQIWFPPTPTGDSCSLAAKCYSTAVSLRGLTELFLRQQVYHRGQILNKKRLIRLSLKGMSGSPSSKGREKNQQPEQDILTHTFGIDLLLLCVIHLLCVVRICNPCLAEYISGLNLLTSVGGLALCAVWWFFCCVLCVFAPAPVSKTIRWEQNTRIDTYTLNKTRQDLFYGKSKKGCLWLRW